MNIIKKLANHANYGGERTPGQIRYIVLHYTANDGDSARANANYFANNKVKASAHYFVDDSEVYLSVPELSVAWSVGGKKYADCVKTGGGRYYGKCTNANSISVEMCDTRHDGKLMASEQTQRNAAELVRELMRRYGITMDHVIRHFDVTGKRCPAYFVDNTAWAAWKRRLSQEPVISERSLQASDLRGLSAEDVVETVGHLFTKDQRVTGVLASVSMAQFILESAYGKSDLAQAANNCFGMKRNLSGNSWPNSMWDGISVYRKPTKEQKTNGEYITVMAEFRAYPNIARSIADHSAYLLGAKNGSKLRYEGLQGCTDYRKAAEIIKAGGYATSLTYVNKLCRVVEKWNLTRFDYHGVAQKQPERKVYPYLVKVTADSLNVRKGPGTRYGINMSIRDHGIYTIVEEQGGWGRLKSGAGWISLAYTKRC